MHGVYLYRIESVRLAASIAASTFSSASTPVISVKSVAVEAVEADRDAVEPGVLQAAA